MKRSPTSIGQILLRLGRISEQDVENALTHQKQHGGLFGEALVALGLVEPTEVEWGLASQYDIPLVRLQPDEIDRDLARRVPAEWVRDRLALPVLRDGATVTAIMADPTHEEVIEEIRERTGAGEVAVCLSPPQTILALVDALYGSGAEPFATWLREALSSHDVGVRVTADEVTIRIEGDAERTVRFLNDLIPARDRRTREVG